MSHAGSPFFYYNLISSLKLLMYLGVSFMLLGSYFIITDAIALTPSIAAALGSFIFSIGLIMSFVGYNVVIMTLNRQILFSPIKSTFDYGRTTPDFKHSR